MSSYKINVHPQAILQIADQAARTPHLNPMPPYVCGLILGSVDGVSIEINTALQIPFKKDMKTDKFLVPHQIDGRLWERQQLEHHVAIYPKEQPIGWYVTRKHKEEDLEKLRTLLEPFVKGESVFRVIFDSDAETPLTIHFPKGDKWIPVDYYYEAELAERIAMMQLQAEGNAESQVAFTADAFRSLDADLALIEDYLKNILSKKEKFDPVLVRKCADLAQWFSSSSSQAASNSSTEIDQAQLSYLTCLMAETLAVLQSKATKIIHPR